MGSGTTVALGLLIAVLGGLLCVRHHAHAIPIDLHTRSMQALQTAGIAGADLRLDGRVATLRGVAGTEAVSEKAQQIVRDTWGVIDVNTEIIQPAEPPPPPPVSAAVQEKLTSLIKLKNIEFETGSAKLTPQGQSIVNEIAQVLTANPEVAVAIEGHTDSDGKPEANLTLSRQRAVAVQQYLIQKKIAAGRLTAEGYGQNRPIADNATPAGRQANRRIEFKVRENR